MHEDSTPDPLFVVAFEAGAGWPAWLSRADCRLIIAQGNDDSVEEFARRVSSEAGSLETGSVAVLAVEDRWGAAVTEARVRIARALLLHLQETARPTLFIAAPWEASESTKHELFGLVEAMRTLEGGSGVNVRLRFGVPAKDPSEGMPVRKTDAALPGSAGLGLEGGDGEPQLRLRQGGD